MSDHELNFEERPDRHPILKNRIGYMPDIIENTSGDAEKANEAELRVIDELRQMGNEILYDWASGNESVKVEELQTDNKNTVGHGKKKIYWYATFGTIAISERVFLQDGHLVRPFSQSAEVVCGGYSQPLHRRITDFGADVPFGKVSEKLEEHYGISVPHSAAGDMTEKHAKAVKDNEILQTGIPEKPGVGFIIAETDGSMIPTADVADDGECADKRNSRKGRWKEARLTPAHPEGSVNPVFGCAIGSPDEAGDQMFNCAVRSGFGQETKVRCAGDGAPRTASHTERVFGEQGSFLTDFYHLCDYPASASEACAPDDHPAFFNKQKELVKENQVSAVPEQLKPFAEPGSVPDNKAPVRCCCRYMTNRPDQSDCKGASDSGLPVGSGEIESAHRYVIQERLKIAGAWWKEDNARDMLSLRVLRANGDWEDYWGNNKAA